jgi:hypothetical protein
MGEGGWGPPSGGRSYERNAHLGDRKLGPCDTEIRSARLLRHGQTANVFTGSLEQATLQASSSFYGAAQESNLPSVGLPRLTGFEDQLGHRARPLRAQRN